MCERLKTHVFLAAPSSISVSDEAVGECSSCVSAAWTHVDLSWQDGRLQPGHQLGAVKKTTLIHHSSEAEGNQRPNAPTEDVCSASVLEYLESCFPLTEPEQPRASTVLSFKTQYLSTWTLSQALALRESHRVAAASPVQTPSRTSPQDGSTSTCCSSTPELFSPAPPSAPPSASPTAPPSASPTARPTTTHIASPTHSAELFTPLRPTPRAEEDCVVLQATAEGLLCSQGEDRDERPCKKPRHSEESGLKSSVDNAGPGEVDPTTPLAQCVKLGIQYSVLVAVVHPCHLKEIRMKSGTHIPLASIIVTDQSGVEMKVALWRRAAFWVLTVSPGDVLLITELQMNEDRWRGETVLCSTYNSKLLNLGRVPLSGPLTDSQQARALSPLCDFLRNQRPLLVSLPAPPVQTLSLLPYATIRSLRLNTLVHMLLRVTHTHLSTEWQSEADSRCRSAVKHRAVIRVEQPGGQQGALVLWGAAVDWLQRFCRDTAAVWDFHTLLVREGTLDLPELHSTPWSSVQALDRTDPRMDNFLQPLRAETSSSSVELDLRTLLSQKYSGEVELRVQVEAFHFKPAPLSPDPRPVLESSSTDFPSTALPPDPRPILESSSTDIPSITLPPDPRPVLDSSSTAADVLKLLSGDVTYTGCGRCGAELDTDSNGIYCPCYPCLPHTTVRRYYRPAVLTLSDCGDHQMCVQVPPVLLQKFLTAPPDKLCRSSAPGSEVKHIDLAAQRLHSLLSLPKRTFTVMVQSHFLCDENSVPLCQEFTLLDLQFPP